MVVVVLELGFPAGLFSFSSLLSKIVFAAVGTGLPRFNSIGKIQTILDLSSLSSYFSWYGSSESSASPWNRYLLGSNFSKRKTETSKSLW